MKFLKQNKQNIIYSIFLLLLFGILITRKDHTDHYYLIALGRDILHTGIPKTHQFFVFDHVSIVCQQWLWCVIVYLFSLLGNFGFILLNGLQIFIITYLSLKIWNTKQNMKIKLFCILLFLYFTFVISERPEGITLILMLWELVIIENYNQTKNRNILYWLPIISILELNIHASVYFIHYVLLLPYLFPFDVFQLKIKQDLSNIKDFLYPILFMIGTCFVSPYGIQSCLYLIKTYQSDLPKYYPIDEMKTIFQYDYAFLFLVGCFTLFFLYLTYQKKLKIEVFYLVFGLTICLFITQRFIFFYYPALLYMIKEVDLETHIKKISLNITTYIELFLVSILFIYIILVNICNFNTVTFHLKEFSTLETPKIIEYFEQNQIDKEHTKIYTGYNNGSYFEMHGFRNIFVDSRMEITLPELNGGYNIAGDYLSVTIPKYTKDFYQKEEPDDELIERFIQKYNFDYYVITNKDKYLDVYLEKSDQFSLVLNENSDYKLYQKK